MASVKNQTVHSSGTIRLKIDGIEVGRAQSVEGRSSFGQQAQYEIGSIMPQEHVALQYEGTVTLDKFKIRKKSLKDLGLAALGVGILNMDVIDIEITDKFTGDIVEVYRGCSLQDYSRSYRVGAICGENATWAYLSADEGVPETVTV
jgi:DNA-directed RNA polymerase subunit H (RpoH/RPB5)